MSESPKLQPGIGFHLEADGSWKAKEIPPDVLREATFSGHLTVSGYRCEVFETPGKEQWAQKATGTSSMASRIARLAGWTRPLLDDEQGELERVSDDLGLDISALSAAFTHGVLKTLSESDWSRLENTDSYSVEGLDEARRLAKEYGRDIESILQALGSQKDLPAPVVLELPDGTLTLVGGNTRLMAARALGISPKVLWMTTEKTSSIASRVAARYLQAKKGDLTSQMQEVFDDEREDDEYNDAIVDFCDKAFAALEELNGHVEGCVAEFANAAKKLSQHSHEKVNDLFARKMGEALMEAARTVKAAGDGCIVEAVKDLKQLKNDASRRSR